jgi:molybdenum cofactor cytidylyltransferase
MGQPKALLELRGQTFLEAILETATSAGLDPRVVVLGAHAVNILSCIDLCGVTTVLNEEMDAGPIGSIRAGIRALFNQQVEAAVVWHVDRPCVAAGTVEALVRAYREGTTAQIVLPEFEGRRGHPVLFGHKVFDELLHAPPEGGARTVVRADPHRVAAIPTADPWVLHDINTPESYRRLIKRLNLPD